MRLDGTDKPVYIIKPGRKPKHYHIKNLRKYIMEHTDICHVGPDERITINLPRKINRMIGDRNTIEMLAKFGLIDIGGLAQKKEAGVLTDEQFNALMALIGKAKDGGKATKRSVRKTGPRLPISQKRVAEDTGRTVRVVQKWGSGEIAGPHGYTRMVRKDFAAYNQWLAIFRKAAEYSAKHRGERTRTVPYRENVTELASTTKNEFDYAAIKD